MKGKLELRHGFQVGLKNQAGNAAHQGPDKASTRSGRPRRSSSLCTATLDDQLDSPPALAVLRHSSPVA